MLAALLLPQTAQANSRPMPWYTSVRFVGFTGEGFYATLLSRDSVSGSDAAYDESSGNAAYDEGDPDYEIWRKFVAYVDSDGYYFLQRFWHCTDERGFTWRDPRPEVCKILLYFPEYDSFAVSEAYQVHGSERYVVNLKYVDITSTAPGPTIAARMYYDYEGEIFDLACRMLLTILVELAVALPFGYRAKKQIALIVVVNIVTQVFLNALLLITNSLWNMLVGSYLVGKLLAFGTEALVYYIWMPKYAKKPIKRYMTIPYAVVANFASLIAGIIFAIWFYSL